MTVSLQDKFDQINAHALAMLPELLREWFPLGRMISKAEYGVANLNGDKGESLCINIHTGRWKEFAGGPGGYDPLGLYAHARCNGDRKQAFRELRAKFGFSDDAPPPKPNGRARLSVVGKDEPKEEPEEVWKSQVPPPDGAGMPSIRRGIPVYTYRGPNGVPLRYTTRHERADKSKYFIPHTYGFLKDAENPNGKTGWHDRHPNEPMCLYGLERLGAGKPVLLQEGEQKSDDVQKLLPGWACLGWSGGGNRAKDHDYSLLTGEPVYVSGDAVDGIKGMNDAAGCLHQLGVKVWTLDLGALGFPKGWDLGNAATGEMWKKGELVWKDPEGPWSAEKIEAFIRANAKPFNPGSGKKERKAKAEDLGGFARDEDGIALAFADKHKDQLRYCHTTGAWYLWTGSRWRREETKLAFSWARDLCRELNSEGEYSLAKAATAAAVERFAQSDRAFAVTGEIWDRDSFLLCTPGGVVDLKTGLMRDARPEDFQTKQTAVAPADPALSSLSASLHGSGCPQWLAFLEQATKGDPELIRFMQQIAGYALTGDTREHALFFIYGPGGNGKGVFLNTITKLLGDYATSAAMDTFTASHGSKHPTDLAKLKGARLVTASETEEGHAWAESRIKQLTGGDRISARFMRQDFFEFDPAFKLLIVGNHKPVLNNVDEAARRRFNIIPFIHKPEVRDLQLEAKLQAEWPGILRWMIDGCLDWQQHGLIRPASVGLATEEYFNSQDLFGQWIAECCELFPGRDTRLETAADLFASWKEFAESNGEQPGNGKAFGDKLTQRGVGSAQRRHPLSGKNCKMRTGISLVRPAPEWGGHD